MRAFRVARIEAFACRAPIARPVATSFGVMHNRPAVFVRIEDADGAFGFGEAFANWPAAGAEHRVNLLIDDIADLVLARDWESPEAMFYELTRATRIRALQCGEPGPFAQVVAALDIAAWDLVARREGLPVARALSSQAELAVPAYASGIHIDAAADVVAAARKTGFSAFKVKVGFDDAADPAKLVRLAETLRADDTLFADANQAWDVEAAERFLDAVSEADLGWIEEPIPAYAAADDWKRLARRPVPLAAGENIAGFDAFDAALDHGALTFYQPDVAKWGGLTGCLAVARKALERGRVYCPHFLGGGIGLAASASVLAAAGGPGLLEVDVNPNPLRDAFGAIGDRIEHGLWRIDEIPGLGITSLPGEIGACITHRREVRRG
ncbi:mandelate racemase/muconate lactonizing enzyme family protein [Martelella soudanensis]|uniref:mandelate racemase/muconate lactonizing enzyme family protein n=1 Tax=unclassified Martelella TaxID=2629616 RepID=UPI0015E040E0|nr:MULTISPECIES: mandelate racemase/muconate lactonizing enzyme family protein [unclassified Martelella]